MGQWKWALELPGSFPRRRKPELTANGRLQEDGSTREHQEARLMNRT